MKKFLKRRFLPFLAVLVVLIGALVLPIGAEIDWLSYPTSNHLDFSAFRGYGLHNATFQKDDELQQVKITPTSSSDPYVWVLDDYLLSPNTTYLMSIFGSSGFNYYVFFSDGTYVQSSSGNGVVYLSFRTPADGLIDLRLDTAGSAPVIFSQFMLVKGTTRYPYQPYIPGGLRDSYEEGFTTGLDYTARVLNPLESASFIRFAWTDNVTSGEKSVDFSYTELLDSSWYSSGAVNISEFLHEQGRRLYPIDENDASSVDGYDGDLQYPTSLSVYVRWPSFMDSSYTQFSLNGPAGGFVAANLYRLVQGSLEAVSPVYSENVINGNYTYNSVRRITFPASVQFEEFSLTVSGSGMLLGSYGPQQLSDMKVNFFSGGTYSQGYSAGLAQGLSVGREEALDQSYKKGYKSGYSTGFDDGKVEGLGIASTGDFRSLILAVVEGPVNTFQSLFDFEILGMDMKAAFGALMTMCVVIIVFKKVVL